jgi:hypothetical protein
MGDESAAPEESLPLSVEQRIDPVCRSFEAAWQAAAEGSTRPRLEDYLAAVDDADRWPLLRELLKLELHYRRAEVPSPEEYGRRFPEYAEGLAALFRQPAPGDQGEGAAREGDREGAAPDSQLDQGANDTAPELPRAGLEQAALRTAALPNIPGYEILSELGHGGMGIVYKARQLFPPRTLALKMIRAGAYAGEQELARFRTEAEAVARLQHPHIVQIFEVGERDGLPYFSLEFCAGGSLASRLNGNPLPATEAAELVETLARAMHVAHQAKVVHRDLKPANVLLAPPPSSAADAAGAGVSGVEGLIPKVTDFGLAKKLEEVGPTQSGVIMGTPSYMAPEQAAGKSKEIGPPADVYALGAILYELLTGRPPFRAATDLETILQVLSEEPVAPRLLQPKLPRDLETICLKCLQKEAKKRYATAEAMATDLARYLKGEPILARPVGVLERVLKWYKRRPAIAVLLAVVLLVFACGSAATYWQYSGAVQARITAEKESELKGIALEQAKQAAEEAKQKARDEELARLAEGRALERARAHLVTAQLLKVQAVYEHDPRQALAVLHDYNMCPLDLRDFAWGFYAQRCVTSRGPREFRHCAARIDSVIFTPGGKTLACVSSDGTVGEVTIWDIATGKQLLNLQNLQSRVVFTPDGKALAASTGRDWKGEETIAMWDATTGQELTTRMRGAARGEPLALSAGDKILARGVGGTIQLWDTTAWTECASLSVSNVGNGGGWPQAAFTSDGRTLVSWTERAGGDPSEVKLWDVATGHERATLENPHGWVALSPDGKTLALVDRGRESTVTLWDIATEKELATLTGAGSPVFSPDGN